MSARRPGVSDRRRAFLELHRGRCFVIPNPWDVGSARFLQLLGFKALATTSSGFAWTQGLRDGGITREQALSHLSEIVAATDVPVNADFQDGFGREPAEVAGRVRRAVGAGMPRPSCEEATGDAARTRVDVCCA